MQKNRKTDSSAGQSLASLQRWLNRRELSSNPFERWNAENDMDLPTYFVDIGNFNEFLQLTMPSIIFAQRGCGKTAQKQMVAAECRPWKANSGQLAVSYTYSGFEKVLESVGYDIHQIRPQHHVDALLYLGLTALHREVKREASLQHLIKSDTLAPQWNAYLSHFAPHLVDSPPAGSLPAIDKLSSVELLQGFISLLTQLGLETCVVLVDGLDEFIYTSDPAQAIKFLAPLLGTLSILECPGFAFKFFLPKELEALVLSCNWFRRDRIQIIPIAWEHADFLHLIEQRLIHFSRREPEYSDLAELCDDELSAMIDNELIRVAGNLPRNVLILADKLLRFHCNEVDPPDLIKLKTWKQVKDWWSKSQENVHLTDRSASASEIPNPEHDPASKEDLLHPVLLIDEKKGTVRLGKKEIRGRLKGKPYSMLLCLYQHRGEVCNKNMIVENVWPDVRDGGYVTDQDIAAVISRLRRILRDVAPDSEYIETITGKIRDQSGYRLVPSGLGKDVT